MPCIVLTSVTHRGSILLAYMQRHFCLSFFYIYNGEGGGGGRGAELLNNYYRRSASLMGHLLVLSHKAPAHHHLLASVISNIGNGNCNLHNIRKSPTVKTSYQLGNHIITAYLQIVLSMILE